MQNLNQVKTYLRAENWEKSDKWLQQEIHDVKGLVVYSRIILHTFGILMSVVLAFFTWLLLYPDAKTEEISAFSLFNATQGLFERLGSIVLGGKAAFVLILIFIPIFTGLIAGLIFRKYKTKASLKFAEFKNGKKYEQGESVLNRIQALEKVCRKYFSVGVPFFYVLLTGALTFGVMVISSIFCGLNPVKYAFLGIVFDFLYAGVLIPLYYFYHKIFAKEKYKATRYIDCSLIVYDKLSQYREKEKKNKKEEYSPFYSKVTETKYYQRKFEEYYAKYSGTPYETEEEKIKRIVREVEGDLTGKGYGDY